MKREQQVGYLTYEMGSLSEDTNISNARSFESKPKHRAEVDTTDPTSDDKTSPSSVLSFIFIKIRDRQSQLQTEIRDIHAQITQIRGAIPGRKGKGLPLDRSG